MMANNNFFSKIKKVWFLLIINYFIVNLWQWTDSLHELSVLHKCKTPRIKSARRQSLLFCMGSVWLAVLRNKGGGEQYQSEETRQVTSGPSKINYEKKTKS